MSKLIITGLLIVVAILAITLVKVANVHKTEVIEKQVKCSVYQDVYTSQTKGCDKIPNCGCLHNTWFGYGACDTCQCIKYVTRCE